MRRFTLFAALLLLCSVSFAQSFDFVLNGNVIADGTILNIKEAKPMFYNGEPTGQLQLESEVLVKNMGDIEGEASLTVTYKGGDNISYCGFGLGTCMLLNSVNPEARRTATIAANRELDPEVHAGNSFSEDEPVVIVSSCEFKLVYGATTKTITLNFNNDPTSINSLEANANVYFSGNEFSYHFNDVANRQLNIYNVTGSLVKSVSLETEGTVAINNLNKGVYIYEVKENGKRIAAHKCVIR